MELTDKRADVLAHIARHPGDDKEEIAAFLGSSVSSISSVISDLREHGLVVQNPGERVEHIAEGDIYVDNDEPEWMITGRGKKMLGRYASDLFSRAVTLYEAVMRSRTYRPPHVRESIDTENTPNDKTQKGGD